MDLLEYQGKQLFARHGVPVPAGKNAHTVDEAHASQPQEIGAARDQRHPAFGSTHTAVQEEIPD